MKYFLSRVNQLLGAPVVVEGYSRGIDEGMSGE
jgi:hypothetical protein